MAATTELLVMLPDREQTLPMSYDEFVSRVAEDAHAEWVDGETTIFMSPKERHQALINLLGTLLTIFVEHFGLGLIRSAPYEMRVNPTGSVREPDLLFISGPHRDRISEEGLAGPADLVIEIMSGESLRRDRADKFYEYQDGGIPEYWLFDPRPRRQRVDLYRLDEQGAYRPILPDENGHYHSAIVPGFWFDPSWLRQVPLPGALSLFSIIVPSAFPQPRSVTE